MTCLTPTRLQSFRGAGCTGSQELALPNASGEVGGRSSATPRFCHCGDPICNSCNDFNLFHASTLPWPAEALPKDATLLTWRILRLLIQHCHSALVQGPSFLMRVANRSQPHSSKLTESAHHVK